mmetsp:Transcript_80038/g.126381  ORF Transcript_80038/g.126381 Transcript_80038/m.126381 type:complete len:265 (-) Transcript_80038:20-814(-)
MAGFGQQLSQPSSTPSTCAMVNVGVGDSIEVYCSSQAAWCPGKIKELHTSTVTVEYVTPLGTSFSKELPAAHPHIRAYQSAEAARGKPAVFFDFDGTLTVTSYIERFDDYATSDSGRSHIIFSLSPEECVGNFGGDAQLSRLKNFLTVLKQHSVPMFIVSHGLTETICYHLEQVGLKPFFDGIYGSDAPVLKQYGGGTDDKAKFIRDCMAQMGFHPSRTFFIDDLERNLSPAQGLCQTMPVRRVPNARPCATHGIEQDMMARIT